MVLPAPHPPDALPWIDQDRCDGCGLCVRACPSQALTLDRGIARLAWPDRCDYCGLCEAACPRQAIACPYEIVLAGRQ